ncbi:SMI1/KNR4 family protein [Micromonospora auratinigra]|uniref:SMI1 / KNR4 family (SUKH-1) n=1 Tax=Micromonospora auratinigra TaxID=261654 RepID=A0A1A8ZA96_9ACTN|nr:SMI1/KNR4 family protein [Micromonospora auratinigra]SBT40760.1 SMI1 / KNR4 family (SUKH-1) [Micromonospora auratinigra]
MDDRIARIQTKLAALPPAEDAVLGPPLTEQQISDFEGLHGVRLPEEFRQFVTRVGHGGYGPTYGLLTMDRWVSGNAEVNGNLAQPFPFVPDAHLAERRTGQCQPAPTFPGAIVVVYRGCSDFTLLVVTGPGCGRLVEVNAEGLVAPHFHTDPDFLAWYERWLDFTLAGHRDRSWFAEQMAGDQQALLATLLHDVLATRRRAAAYTFITYPAPSAQLPEDLVRALSTEPHPAVRKAILRALAAQGARGRELLPAALADPVPTVRSLAAILMTTNTPKGWRLSPQLRRTLGDHVRVEEDHAVRDTVQRVLDHSL